MNAKVLVLVQWVRQGFEVAAVDGTRQGGVRIRLRRGDERKAFRFAHFEVPAIVQECRSVGVAK